jgi:hypothetical protein
MKKIEWSAKADGIRVKFLKSRSPYTIGEIASFPPEKAQWYISNGVARELKKKKKDREPGYVTKESVSDG